jgi:predicted NAD-dependent protein-ADP-ribosyltransferase YbiA (DUF1768 family)
MKEIAFTKVSLPYGWLGNMSPYPVTYDGKVWKTTEALFQALRFEDEEIREAIRKEPSPMGCKFRVKAIVKELTQKGELHKRTVEPLSKQDVENMEMCVRLKLQQHPNLLWPLIETVDIPIFEDVTSRGKKGTNLFWGAMKMEDGSWEGKNILGRIWMKIRKEEIQKFKKPAQSELNYKFGLSEDPYKVLKNANSEGYEILELSFDNMKWYVNESPNFSKPVACYKIREI